jgi:hypothetical protein
LNSVVSGNTVSAELSNELNNTLNTGPVTTNNDNSTHFSVTGQFNRGDRSAPAVAASLAHYESILPFVTCEEDRILVRQFIARVYERPPTYFFEGVEQLDYRKITLILHLTKCYEENYSAYVLSVPYDGNRIHLERLSNTQLSSLCTDGPLSRLRSNPVEPGLSMDWDQQIENLRSIEKGWNKYYLPPEQGNTNWHKAELKINRLICEQNYIDELRALQTKTTDYSKRLGLEVRITKVMESSKVDP